MIPISSRENPVFKSFCKCGQKKYRRAMGCYLCEGANMASEALDFGLSVRAAFVREGEEERFGPLIGRLEGRCPVYRLTAPLFQTLCDAVTPQGICLALEIPKHMPEPATWAAFCGRPMPAATARSTWSAAPIPMPPRPCGPA